MPGKSQKNLKNTSNKTKLLRCQEADRFLSDIESRRGRSPGHSNLLRLPNSQACIQQYNETFNILIDIIEEHIINNGIRAPRTVCDFPVWVRGDGNIGQKYKFSWAGEYNKKQTPTKSSFVGVDIVFNAIVIGPSQRFGLVLSASLRYYNNVFRDLASRFRAIPNFSAGIQDIPITIRKSENDNLDEVTCNIRNVVEKYTALLTEENRNLFE